MSTATSAPIEELSKLVAGGRQFQDGWVPIAGTVDSGFRHPANPLDGVASITGGDPAAEAPRLRDLLDHPRTRAVVAGSDAYPAALRDLDGRPAVLYVRGNLPDPGAFAVAIVGSRRASELGIRAARDIAHALGERGWAVVSGLAAGVDTAAHRAALDGGATTVAVMGTGLGKIFPSTNRELADQIADNGALVTQFPPGWGPTKTTFPARNALIAALSSVSVLIELQEHSGTMIEARCALAQGKPVALWGPLLRGTDWAERFVATTRARFVENAEEVSALANR